jgi:hypothetical protein
VAAQGSLYLCLTFNLNLTAFEIGVVREGELVIYNSMRAGYASGRKGQRM